ncbi:MAG: hypothetical protein M1587_09790, partial [Thaumarchaeota archaeon]|nr:hypothetical protein [Nitrososphaerota archaeon]
MPPEHVETNGVYVNWTSRVTYANYARTMPRRAVVHAVRPRTWSWTSSEDPLSFKLMMILKSAEDYREQSASRLGMTTTSKRAHNKH